VLDLPVFVRKDIPLGNHAAPRNFWVGAAEFLGNPAGSLADDLHGALDGQLQLVVALLGIGTHTGCEFAGGTGRVQHIPQHIPKKAESRSTVGINHLFGAQYGLPPEGIAHSAVFNQVHRSSKDGFQFLLHLSQVPQTPACLYRKTD
jgi:hypothetical protein